MSKKVYLTEAQLRKVVAKAAKRIVNEGFMNNLKGAVQGAYNGYKVAQSLDKNKNYKIMNDLSMAVKNLYDKASWLAQDINNEGGNMMINRLAYSQVKDLKNIIARIEAIFKENSKAYRDSEEIHKTDE